MRLLKTGLTLVAGCLLALAQPAWSAPARTGLSFEEGFAPAQDLSLWPLEIAHGYPLVRAQVGEVQGVFMIDTGTPWGLLLNSARIQLADASFVLSGAAGSGQKLTVNRSATMPTLTIHGQRWEQVRQVHSADLAFIENGTAMGPFLGFIGANFLKDSALTLDYARRLAMLQRLNADGAPLLALPAAQSGGQLLATLAYRGEQPNFPIFDALLGGMPVRVMLDSGNRGASISRAWLASLQASGAAVPFSRIDDAATYRLPPLLLGGLALPVEDVTLDESPAVLDGKTDPQVLKIGYSLLKRLGVTWNYRLHSMTFFTP